MTTTDQRQRVELTEVEAYVDLVDTEPVPLVETDDDDDYERRAAEHLGEDEPHDDADVLPGVEIIPMQDG